MSLVKDESEKYFYQGQTLLSAASFLSINDFKNAISVLLRTNELYLAYYIAKFFYPPALKEVTLMLCEKAERFFQSDVAVLLMNENLAESELSALARRRMMNNGLIKKSQSQQDVDFKNEQKGMQLLDQGEHLQAVYYLILANHIEKACEKALPFLKDCYKSNDPNQFEKMFEMVDLVQQVSLQSVNQKVRDCVLLYSYYCGIFKSIWLGFYEILGVLINQISDLLEKVSQQIEDPRLYTFIQGIESSISERVEMKSHQMKSNDDGPLYREPLVKVEVKF